MRTNLSEYFSKLFAGDLAAFGETPTDEAVAGHIRSEQVSLVLGNSGGFLLANACNAIILAVALWHSPDGVRAAIWAAAVAAGAIWSGYRSLSSRRITKPPFVSRRALHRLVRNALLGGLAWAVIPLAFFANASHGGQLVITCLCSGMLAGSALAFATIPIAAIAFTGPIFLGSVVCLLRIGDFFSILMTILVAIYGTVLLRAVFAHSFEFTRRIVTQLEAERIVRQDPLTRLPNRIAFNETLESALNRLART